jgi:hypothetical protein
VSADHNAAQTFAVLRTLTDASTSPVSDRTINLRSASGEWVTNTNGAAEFRFDPLPPGDLTLEVTVRRVCTRSRSRSEWAGKRRHVSLWLSLAIGRGVSASGCRPDNLWGQGYVEPIEPPLAPYHLVAQQSLALVLQQGGVGRRALNKWLEPLLCGAHIDSSTAAILDYMLEAGILSDDSGILGVGPEGERLFGRKHYMTFLSIFDSPPVFTVFWDRKTLAACTRSRSGGITATP